MMNGSAITSDSYVRISKRSLNNKHQIFTHFITSIWHSHSCMREKERGRERKKKKVLKVDVRVLSESCVDFQSSEKKHLINENQIFLKISSFLPSFNRGNTFYHPHSEKDRRGGKANEVARSKSTLSQDP